MSIHKQAVEVLGPDERLQKLCEELIEAAHAVYRARMGKATPDEAIDELFDVLYVARSLQHMPGWERYNEQEQFRHAIHAEAKLRAAMTPGECDA